MLDRIGIETGWRCAELSCGGGGIMDLLSVRGGPKGHVVGLDQQENSLAAGPEWRAGKRQLPSVGHIGQGSAGGKFRLRPPALCPDYRRPTRRDGRGRRAFAEAWWDHSAAGRQWYWYRLLSPHDAFYRL